MIMDKDKEIWTIGAILKWTGQYFNDKGVDNPRLDAEVLLSHILGKDRLYLYVHFDQPLNKAELAAFREAVKKRVMHLPVAYITGHKEFMGLDLAINARVLIPRPDTEILVETALHYLKGADKPDIVDLGAGSGAIIVSMLVKIPAAAGVAVDISAEALTVVQANAVKHQVSERLTIKQGDLFAPVAGQVFDAILSNPPYIPDRDIAVLAPEVQREPRLALAGGKDGLDFYRRIVDKGPAYLKPGGFVALEVGIDQAQAVAAMAEQSDCLKVDRIVKDYAGIDRVVVLVAS